MAPVIAPQTDAQAIPLVFRDDSTDATKIIDGKATATLLEQQLKEELADHPVFKDTPPTLQVMWVGQDTASKIYVGNKVRGGKEAGVDVHLYPTRTEDRKDYTQPVPGSITEVESVISQYNHSPAIDGIIVQSPLPVPGVSKDDMEGLFEDVDPIKDVDGFTDHNLNLLKEKRAGLISCTPLGAMYLINGVIASGAELPNNSKAVVFGRSKHTGQPIATMLEHQGFDVTMFGSKTHTEDEKRELSAQADVVVSAVGSPKPGQTPHRITTDYVKKGAIVIDIGMRQGPDGKTQGDVDLESVMGKAGYVNPTPRGTGPMTVMALLVNTVIAAHHRRARETVLPATAQQVWAVAKQREMGF